MASVLSFTADAFFQTLTMAFMYIPLCLNNSAAAVFLLMVMHMQQETLMRMCTVQKLAFLRVTDIHTDVKRHAKQD